MSQIRISQLPQANTVAGNTVIPVVQAGTTQQATVDVLRAEITADITFVESTVSAPDGSDLVVVAKDSSGNPNARLVLDPSNEIARLEVPGIKTESFQNGSWATANWTTEFGQAVLVFNDAQAIYEFLIGSEWGSAENRTLRWNDLDAIDWTDNWNFDDTGGVYTVTIFLPEEYIPEGTVEVTEVAFGWTVVSKIAIDRDDFQELQIRGADLPIDISTQNNFEVRADRVEISARRDADSLIRLYAGNYVRIRTNNYDGSSGIKQWEFTQDAKLTLPSGGEIFETVVTDNPTVVVKPANAVVESQALYIKGGEAEDYHLHLTTGDLTQTSVFLGTDEQHFKVSTAGSVDARARVGSPVVLVASDDPENVDKYYFTVEPNGMFFFNGTSFRPVGVAPATSKGSAGDQLGMVAFTSSYIYYCTANYVDGVDDIWRRVVWSESTW